MAIASPRDESGPRARGKPDWEREGRDWPHRAASRFVRAGGLRWHVQQMGTGPVALLVHGTAAATHSWRGFAPLLAERHTVIALDLPGHGFTETPRPTGLSLEGMAEALTALLESLGVSPRLAIGHSAGVAILARMCADARIAPRALIGLNAALLPFEGAAGVLFSPLARAFAAFDVLPRIVAWRARDAAAVARLIASTGSKIDAEGVELYRRLLAAPGHVGAVIQMMAQWDLHALGPVLAGVRVPVTLVAAERDRAVAAVDADRAAALLPFARVVRLPGLGHLAHEEAPAAVFGAIEV